MKCNVILKIMNVAAISRTHHMLSVMQRHIDYHYFIVSIHVSRSRNQLKTHYAPKSRNYLPFKSRINKAEQTDVTESLRKLFGANSINN